MICMNCGQREAEVFIKQIVNGEQRDLHFCRTCAMLLGHVDKIAPCLTISFSLRQVPADSEQPVDGDKGRYDALACPGCGLVFSDFKKSGRLGCVDCYSAFRFPLGDFFQRYHGAESHWAETSIAFDELATVDLERDGITAPEAAPSRMPDSRLLGLRCELNDALDHEEYERASVIRDKIREIESRGDGDA